MSEIAQQITPVETDLVVVGYVETLPCCQLRPPTPFLQSSSTRSLNSNLGQALSHL